MKALVPGIATAFVFVTASGAPVEGPPRPLTPPKSVVSPVLQGARPVPIDELLKSARSEGAAWSTDGRSIFYSSGKSGRINLWSQSLTNEPPRQLSKSERAQVIQGVTPDGKWVLFVSDVGGREINDLYALPTTGGDPIGLTATPEQNETWPKVSHDGKFVALSARELKESSLNVAVLDWATRKVRRLTSETVDGLQWMSAAISRDGRYIFANRFDWSLTVGEVHRIDVATGARTRLTPEGVYANVADVSPDGRYVSIAIEAEKGVNQAAVLELSTGQRTLLAPGPWEQKAGRFSPDGKRLLFVTNGDGRESVFAYELATRKVQDLNFPVGQNGPSPYSNSLPAFSNDGRSILFAHSSGAEPGEHWVYDVSKGTARPVTQLGVLDTALLPKTQLVRYPSRDGTVISAYLWMPYNLERNGTGAAVVLCHGGPTGQVIDEFNRKATALASRGFLVLAPNFRGSTGYGRAFLDANIMDLGGGDLEDVVAGARFLAQTGYVDPKKIGITGGSYGGYLTYMGIAKTPEVWAAAVSEFGVVNMRAMWNNSPPQNRRYLKGFLGDPAEHPDVYDRASPLTYLHQVRAPLLVLHGETDPRVPIVEAHQVIDYLRKHGRVVDAHIYPEEGHGFVKRETQLDALTSGVQWFEKYLKGR